MLPLATAACRAAFVSTSPAPVLPVRVVASVVAAAAVVAVVVVVSVAVVVVAAAVAASVVAVVVAVVAAAASTAAAVVAVTPAPRSRSIKREPEGYQQAIPEQSGLVGCRFQHKLGVRLWRPCGL